MNETYKSIVKYWEYTLSDVSKLILEMRTHLIIFITSIVPIRK